MISSFLGNNNGLKKERNCGLLGIFSWIWIRDTKDALSFVVRQSVSVKAINPRDSGNVMSLTAPLINVMLLDLNC